MLYTTFDENRNKNHFFNLKNVNKTSQNNTYIVFIV